MHPDPVFHTHSVADNLAFARERGFGILAIAHDGVPMLAHVPFVLSGDGTQADLHLMRSNPVARAIDRPLAAHLAISGPDSYISPDWYGIDGQVPTWNYVAVHLTGTIERLPDTELRRVLDQLSEHFEQKLAPKPAWTADKMPVDALNRMMRMIVPLRLRITGVDGTWKLSQNKPDSARERAAGFVDAFGGGAEERALAALMRGVLDS